MMGIVKAVVTNPLVRKGALKVLGTVVVALTTTVLGAVVEAAGDGIVTALKKAASEETEKAS